MSSTDERRFDDPDDALNDQAAAWYLRLQAPDCSDTDRQAFAQWRDADPRHRQAYQAMAVVWAATGPRAGEPDARPPARRVVLIVSLCLLSALIVAWAIFNPWPESGSSSPSPGVNGERCTADSPCDAEPPEASPTGQDSPPAAG